MEAIAGAASRALEGIAHAYDAIAAVPTRTKLFYCLLCLPILLWALLVVPGWLFDDSALPKQLAYALVYVSPIVAGDISIFGQITPVVLAGAIISLLPKQDQLNVPAVILAIVTYVLFIHLGWYFTEGAGDTLIQQDWQTDAEKAAAAKTILSFTSTIRTMALVIAGTIVGLKVREKM